MSSFLSLQMSVEERLVQQYWVGDSHLNVNHHFPAQYELVRNALPDESQRYWLSPDLTHVKGGRRFTDDWVRQLCEVMLTPAHPRNYVICCGTNNIRDAGIMGLEKVKAEILGWHSTLIEAINETERGTLLIVSPIPDNRSWTQWIGEELDTELREMCHKAGQRVRYAPFRTTKTTFNGDTYRWRQELYADDVHLNRRGARQLAEVVLQQQNNFPSAVYGIRRTGPSAARIVEAEHHGLRIDPHRDLRVTRLLHTTRRPETGRRDPRSRLPPS